MLDEVLVHARDDARLDAFLHRWNGEVLDSFPTADGGQDHLVRVDTSRAGIATLPADLRAVEPDHAGPHTADDDRVIRLLALAAAEGRADTEVMLDWLVEPTGITDDELFEASDITQDGHRKNVFDRSYLRGGGALDTGVAPAWQLLDAHGALDERVRYMVVDGGFSANPDFPDPTPSSSARSPGRPGPVAELIAVGNPLDYGSILRGPSGSPRTSIPTSST